LKKPFIYKGFDVLKMGSFGNFLFCGMVRLSRGSGAMPFGQKWGHKNPQKTAKNRKTGGQSRGRQEKEANLSSKFQILVFIPLFHQ
jgi:hypothetical protein